MRVLELSPIECWGVLTRTNLGRLACAFENQPYIVPIYFYPDEQHLYSFATLGRKIEWMRANPRVCLEVDEITDQFHWTTVIVIGEYQELGQRPEYDAARKRAQELFQKRPEWWLPGAAKTESAEHHVPILYRIRIRQLTGRRAARARATDAEVSRSRRTATAPRWWKRVLEPLRKD
jgi:nitroimidazol reductase NimA-like FMN-containing flavoprotein (pyridoxamine 5'-phosphate oxidase superfamily)